MGEVYRARDLRLERTVALEVLPEIFTSDPERLDAEGNPSAVSNSPTLTARVRASVRRRGV
jgi:serine/threonine protein kinase